jgi:hypothetical protein
LDLPDVIGWELSRAREECRALDIGTSILLIQAPRDGGVVCAVDEEDDTLRVVAVRAISADSVLLIVCPECW